MTPVLHLAYQLKCETSALALLLKKAAPSKKKKKRISAGSAVPHVRNFAQVQSDGTQKKKKGKKSIDAS